MGVLELLSSKILPGAVKAKSFGADVTKFISFKEDGQKGVDQYSSLVKFGDVTLEKKNGERFIQPVVIKTNNAKKDETPRSYVHKAFHNEVLFYTKILPALRKYDKDGFLDTCFCEFVYGNATNGEQPEDDAVILKNLNQKGFKLASERIFLDEKHIKLALDRLGKFHALSMAFQMDNPKIFDEIVSQVIMICFADHIGGAISKETFGRNLRRGVEPLKDDPKYKDMLLDLNSNLNHAKESWKKSCSPTENLTVIAHGDFHRNNIMFKYDPDGDPVEMSFFDFQFIKACTPVVDMGILLFLNTTPEVRSSHWEEFLKTYHSALSAQLDCCQKKPSFEMVELDWRKKGIYGYYAVSLYAPGLVSVIDGVGPLADMTSELLDELDENEQEELVEKLLLGTSKEVSSKVTEMLVGIVKHMFDKNFIFCH